MTASRTASRPTRVRAAVLVTALLTTLLTVVGSGDAAEPADGTISLDSPRVDWSGAAVSPANPLPSAGETNACPPGSADPGSTVCDYFELTVDVPEDFWDDRVGGVRIVVAFTEGDDWDIAVFRSDTSLLPETAAISGNNPEIMTVDRAVGRYEVRLAPYLVTSGEGYTAYAELFVNEDVRDPVSPGFQAFHPTSVPPAELPAEDFDNPTASWDGPQLQFESTYVGRDSAEPTVGVDKDGVAYYAAGAFDALPEDSPSNLARTELLRSTDGGKTWQEVTPQVAGADQPLATLDPYVYVDDDTGRVFDVDLLVADKALWFSDDKGETWTPSAIDLTNTVQDHQTLFTGPPPADFALADLMTFDEIVYYCFNKIAEATCSRSLDGGQTFTRTGTPAFIPVDGASFCGSLHGHVATDDEGRLFLPKGHCSRPWIGISEDAGETWETVLVADMSFPEQQASVDADSAGNLYYVWYDGTQQLPYLATSTDHGRTWSEPQMIAPPGVTEVQWPTVWAGDEGRVAVGFPCSRATGNAAKAVTRPWDHCIVASIDALSVTPTYVSNISNPIGDPVHRGECPGRCGNMYDFLDLIVAPAEAGGEIWATYTDTCTDQVFLRADGSAYPRCDIDPAASGFDGSSDQASGAMDGFAVRQTCGPSLLESVGTIDRACAAAAPAPDPAPEPAPEPSGPPLPATGGGWALLGALLAGAGAVVRRRRA